MVQVGPSDDSFWGIPNEEGNPEGAYMVKVIATDPYAGRFEHETLVYVSPTPIRLFSMFWQGLTIIGSLLAALWASFYGRAFFFNTFRKGQYTCVPRVLDVGGSELEEFHLCRADEKLVDAVVANLNWRNFFSDGGVLDGEKLKKEVEHWLRANLKNRKSAEQAHFRWRGKDKKKHVVVRMASRVTVGDEEVDQNSPESGGPGAALNIGGGSRPGPPQQEAISGSRGENEILRDEKVSARKGKNVRRSATEIEAEESEEAGEEAPLHVLLRVGPKSSAYIYRAVALRIQNQRHESLCLKERNYARAARRAQKEVPWLEQWAYRTIADGIHENVPILQLTTSETWHAAAQYCDWTRVFCQPPKDDEGDFEIDESIVDEALAQIAQKKRRARFYGVQHTSKTAPAKNKW